MLLADHGVLFRSGRLPERLLYRNVHKGCHLLLYLPKIPSFLSTFSFFRPTQMDVNSQSHKVNRAKMLDTMHIYLFVQNYFYPANPLMHINSRLQFANSKVIPLYARTQRPLPVPTEYLQCVEGGATTCMYEHTFSLFLPRLDCRQVGESRANTEGESDPKSAALKYWLVTPSSRRLSKTRQGTSGIP